MHRIGIYDGYHFDFWDGLIVIQVELSDLAHANYTYTHFLIHAFTPCQKDTKQSLYNRIQNFVDCFRNLFDCRGSQFRTDVDMDGPARPIQRARAHVG